MNKQIISNIMAFMMRVELKGQEVPAFNVAMNALQLELNRDDETHEVGKDAGVDE